jgi:hypothetical protein
MLWTPFKKQLGKQVPNNEVHPGSYILQVVAPMGPINPCTNCGGLDRPGGAGACGPMAECGGERGQCFGCLLQGAAALRLYFSELRLCHTHDAGPDCPPTQFQPFTCFLCCVRSNAGKVHISLRCLSPPPSLSLSPYPSLSSVRN